MLRLRSPIAILIIVTPEERAKVQEMAAKQNSLSQHCQGMCAARLMRAGAWREAQTAGAAILKQQPACSAGKVDGGQTEQAANTGPPLTKNAKLNGRSPYAFSIFCKLARTAQSTTTYALEQFTCPCNPAPGLMADQHRFLADSRQRQSVVRVAQPGQDHRLDQRRAQVGGQSRSRSSRRQDDVHHRAGGPRR